MDIKRKLSDKYLEELNRFIKTLVKLYGKDERQLYEIEQQYETIKFLKNNDSVTIITLFTEYIIQCKDDITERNDNFFLQASCSSIQNNIYVNIINCLRQLWINKISHSYKEEIWNDLNLFIGLSEKFLTL